jgi:pimeloyl-ACP methyl ester carboxylesterase
MLRQGRAMSTSMLSHALLGTLIFGWLLLVTHSTSGEIIVKRQDNGLLATAQLMQGDANKKAVILLHSFLQTRDFFTVRRLAEALHDTGHTVLLPNLTLGIDRRLQSLACEAIHTHSMEQDTVEIDFWTNWLHQQSGQKVTLIGHSVGSLELLAYLSKESDPPVNSTILISLIPFAQGSITKENETQRQQALQQLAHGQNSISTYGLAYCNSYTTTPENYLSYMAWNGNKTLENLSKLKINSTIVLGGEDQRLEHDWRFALKQAGAEVVEIPGANHFFDHEHEFDLLDNVLERLKQ